MCLLVLLVVNATIVKGTIIGRTVNVSVPVAPGVIMFLASVLIIILQRRQRWLRLFVTLILRTTIRLTLLIRDVLILVCVIRPSCLRTSLFVLPTSCFG